MLLLMIPRPLRITLYLSLEPSCDLTKYQVKIKRNKLKSNQHNEYCFQTSNRGTVVGHNLTHHQFMAAAKLS